VYCKSYISRHIVALVLLLSLSLTDGPAQQNAFEKGQAAFKERQYPIAASNFRNALDHYEQSGEIDSALLVHHELYKCYLNQFKLDSTFSCLQNASAFAKMHDFKEDYLDFTIAAAEMKFMGNELDATKSLFTEVANASDEYPEQQARAYYRLGSIAYNQLDSANAFIFNRKALEIATEMKDTSMLANVYGSIAIYHNEFGDKKKALEYHLKALPLYEPNSKGQVSSYRKIAYIFFYLRDLDKARQYNELSLKLADENEFFTEKAHCLNLLGELSMLEQDFRSAVRYYNECAELFEFKRQKSRLLYAYTNLFAAYTSLGEFNKANEVRSLAYSYYEPAHIGHKFQYHYHAANLYYKLNRPTKMLGHIQDCMNIQANVDSHDKDLKVLKLNILYHKLTRQHDTALRFTEQYHTLKDSLYKREHTRDIHELETQYQKAEQEKEIAFLNAENTYKQSILLKKNLLLYGGAVVLLFFVFLSYLIYRLYQKVKNQNEITSNALEIKETLLKEIHHRVKNNLQVISSMLSLQSRYISDSEAVNALKQGQNRVHSMALIHRDLYEKENLGGVNTRSYVSQLTEKLMESYDISRHQVNIKLDVEPLIFGLDTMIPVGLIINELVSNCFKHAFGPDTSNPTIRIILKQKENRIRLEVADNGKGLWSKDSLETDQSFGFELVKAFAEKLEADLAVVSKNGLSVSLLFEVTDEEVRAKA